MSGRVYSLDSPKPIRAGDIITVTYHNGEVVSVILHRLGWLTRIVQLLLRKVKDG